MVMSCGLLLSFLGENRFIRGSFFMLLEKCDSNRESRIHHGIVQRSGCSRAPSSSKRHHV